ncbi:prepilin-type N-terminal cleavage/methylation domain-containing protein [Serratia sp. FDAARGOS_506]|uniref:prepilin-type N-terminal cleavage/methylation domain-containing protein n=1 Tax=Serratia sp. FDAARGOS_506 TaxID=2420306 RepID=UPI000F4E5B4A|nr:prepilin-type N-terminal cleavage/methylation domain-containing protein [Serratia sp. FDAARGOS_506]AYZ30094.1 prepilin-type N-terminal cleavage/methylation domain-containing protein [Serratia sp. FDAARGOS_506]
MAVNARAARISRNGFSLPEVLVAALLFSVSLLGLLQYHQVLLQSFQRQWHYRQAWVLAHQQLEAFAVTGRLEEEPLLEGWRRETALGDVDSDCRRLMVRVQTPQRQWATLSRWYCTRF